MSDDEAVAGRHEYGARLAARARQSIERLVELNKEFNSVLLNIPQTSDLDIPFLNHLNSSIAKALENSEKVIIPSLVSIKKMGGSKRVPDISQSPNFSMLDGCVSAASANINLILSGRSKYQIPTDEERQYLQDINTRILNEMKQLVEAMKSPLLHEEEPMIDGDVTGADGTAAPTKKNRPNHVFTTLTAGALSVAKPVTDVASEPVGSHYQALAQSHKPPIIQVEWHGKGVQIPTIITPERG